MINYKSDTQSDCMGVDQALSKMTQCAQPTLGLHEKTVLFGLRKTFFQNFAEIGESK